MDEIVSRKDNTADSVAAVPGCCEGHIFPIPARRASENHGTTRGSGAIAGLVAPASRSTDSGQRKLHETKTPPGLPLDGVGSVLASAGQAIALIAAARRLL
jgi:hypothetical protein